MSDSKRKVTRTETIKLNDHSVFMIQSLSNSIRVAQEIIAENQKNMNYFLGLRALEDYGFRDDAELRFSNFDPVSQTITIEESEGTDGPKETAGDGATPTTEEKPASESSSEQASAETEKSSEETQTQN